jgi:3-methyladenine DNA glycosylase/8-oxoguanine DNA glycosylase
MSTTHATTLGSRSRTLSATLPGQISRVVRTFPTHTYRERDRLNTMAMTEQPIERTFPLSVPLDLRLTLLPLARGRADPTIRLAAGRAARATRTPDGPATLHLEVVRTELRARAWGPGAGWALAGVPALVGLGDDPAALRPRHPIVAELARRMTGLRLGRTNRVIESLVPAIFEQKVTGSEASHAFRGLIRRHGERAPGPYDLRLLPPPERLAALPYYAYHPLGVERRRADTIRWACAHADRLEQIADMPYERAYACLRSLPGIGPWTTAEVGLRALGDADAVSVGDFHIPNTVAWALAGEPRANDERMLELLEPYRGQRGRVIRLLEAAGVAAPRFGPRLSPRAIAAI